MKVYLAVGHFGYTKGLLANADVLCSYIYLRGNDNALRAIKQTRNFMLDSGVYSMINSKKNISIEHYADEYAQFVKDNNIKQYVELDVDQIYGVEYTRRLRDRIENRVGWQSIPVWHTIRGKESFIDDAKNYSYIALGYFLTEGIRPSITEKYAKSFCDLAHLYGCRIHGLGFTKTNSLPNIPFDSVDSSSWTASYRYGNISIFDGKNMVKKTKPANKRLRSCRDVGRFCFLEWRKFQDYALYNINPIWV